MPIDCKVHATTPELVLFIYCHGVLTVQDIESFSSFFNSYLHGNIPFKVFFDLRKVDTASRQVLKPMTTYMASFEQLAPGKVVASSVLINNIAIEGLIKLLFNLKPPKTPTKVTSNLEEACNFMDEYDCYIEDQN